MKNAPLLVTLLFFLTALVVGCSSDEGSEPTCNDSDGDRYGTGEACLGTDCNDSDATVNPGASEVPYDGKDNDCNSTTPDDDLDGDGYMQGFDCDDSNPEISPDATENCTDGLDNNCDGTTDGQDDDCNGCAELLPCDDGNVCTDDDCEMGVCVHEPVADGAACDDGLVCTENDACAGGECVGTQIDCTGFADVCEVGVCEEETGECRGVTADDGTPCDDGKACTQDDACTSGYCRGQQADCSDLNDDCNTGVCDEEQGGCLAVPHDDGTACDDGLYCTETDGCQAGVCVGTERDCTSLGDVCNSGHCDEDQDECVVQPDNEGQACDDSNPCTLDDACDGGSCVGTPVVCDQGEQCVNGQCRCGGSGPDCGASETCCGTACVVTATDPENCGGCGIDCLSYEYCEQGTCTPECGIGTTVAECWECKFDPQLPGPDYEQYDYILGSHCMGTNHQDITDIDRVVFLGDSITMGTPPNWADSYRYVLTDMLKAHFGLFSFQFDNCSDWGARNDDLLLPPNQQILNCFPDIPDERRTLVIMTVGSNDLFAMAEASDAGEPPEVIMQMAVGAMQLFDDAVRWFTDDPAKFPNGVFLIFANIYEYTDATGDMSSCPSCALVGLCADWPDGRPPAVYMGEHYMETAVNTGTDMIFLLENFCGHGWHFDNPESQCYLGEDSQRWIDITCLHPEPIGHQQIADMFMAVIEE